MLQKSIVIPCFNEKNTILKILEKVKGNINENDEIIIVDDGSNDGTLDLLKEMKDIKTKIIFHKQNMGKGAALNTAFKEDLKEIVIIQDADLEYDPSDYKKLLLPFEETNADIVYGSRFVGGSKYVRIHFFWHFIANKLLTFFCNAFANLNLTDMETGYKAFKKDCLKDLNLQEKGFGIEPEITIKFAKRKLKFFEVPISYNGRSYQEGKKIGLKDAFVAVYCILKYSLITKKS